jgi:hypothetical protein
MALPLLPRRRLNVLGTNQSAEATYRPQDVRDTQRLTGLKEPYSDLWHLVVTVGPEEAAELTLPNATLNVTREGDSKPTTLTIPVKI